MSMLPVHTNSTSKSPHTKMNSLEQYINLYETNRDTIDAHSAGALNARRPQALQNLKMAGRLADSGDEGFEKTSVNDMFAPDFGVNIN